MDLKRFGIVLVAGCLAASACSTARYAFLTPTGGIVATPSNREGNRMKSLALIERKCPGGYQINHEGEVLLGTVTTHDFRSEPNIFDGTDIRQTTRTRVRSEWHMDFTCK
jgi:hypothetical protein